MKRARNSSRRPRLLPVFLCAALVTPSAAVCLAQKRRGEPSPDLKPGERVVEVEPRERYVTEDSDALSVTEIRVGGERVTPGRPFAADADWLRTLTVRVRNDAAKPITYVQFHFTLPETRRDNSYAGFFLHFNNMTLGWVAADPAKQLPPGEEADLSFIGGEYESTLTFVGQRSGVTEFTRLWIGKAHIIFADGTRSSVSKPVRMQKVAATPGGVK